ncbi:MAG: hypothetical protein J6S67_17910 [Methanobrevibacter sp.]|nr:hypothetical protein [Methanobrevibacter sp.]
MDIAFGVTTSEKRQLDKSVSYAVSVSGTLRNETNVVNPTILVQANISTLAGCNYMSIPAFHRVYFITDVRAITDKLCEVSGHCDVLSTYKDGIRTNTAIVGRSATQGNWNLLMNDTQIKLNNKKQIIVKKGFNSFPKNQFSMILITTG